MELSQLGFLEELAVAPTRDTWNTLSTGFSDLFPNTSWSTFDSFIENPSFAAAFSTPNDHEFQCPYSNQVASSAAAYPFCDDGFTMPELDTKNDDPIAPLVEGHEEKKILCCKVEEQQQCTAEIPVFKIGMCCDNDDDDDVVGGRKKPPKCKKLQGQPSKNLMAERRRRKRLNDRLSMLRSIVPKISKMDRTSILGDAIDYMKELLERIDKFQEEEGEESTSQINLLGISKELKPNEAIVRNSHKFDVERRDQDTRISICCATKPGLLLSTVNTLEALGLEIQQCVVSSFNDFAMEASCSEVAEQRSCISPEEIKQALFSNAGFGGRCI